MSREDLPVDGTIDAGLFLLELATPPGVERSQKELLRSAAVQCRTFNGLNILRSGN